MLRSALLAKLGVGDTPKKSKSFEKTSKAPKKTIKQSSKIKSKKKLKPNPTEKKSTEFDEEIQELETQFRVSANVTKQAVDGIITLTSANPKLKNKLFEDEQFPLFLQVNSFKVPKAHSRIVRFPLKHSLLTPDSEVCLIVPDVKGIPNKNHEEHLEHYETLLSNKGVTCIKRIMTFHEFRTEYETFELKNRLVELYDAFLVDGRISGKTVRKCGKIFYKKRKVPTSIKLNVTKLKEHINQTLQKTPMYLHGKGDSFMVQIGHSKMDKTQVVENIFYLLRGLSREFPGGFSNIRNLNLYTFRGITFPIYTSLRNKNEVDIPEDVSKQQTVKEYVGELTTRLNAGVIVKETGEVTVFALKSKEGDLEEKPEVKKLKETVLSQEDSKKENSKKRKLQEDNKAEKHNKIKIMIKAKKKRKVVENAPKTAKIKKRMQN